MNPPLYPLLLAPVYKDYLWGGTRIAARYGRAGTPAICAESWEISAHPDGPSRVTNGALAGQTLADLATRLGRALVGGRAPRPDRFPLLCKLIDARENLSVQVHPADDTASRVGGDPKTEAWYVVERAPGAVLYAGLPRGTTAASFRHALSQGTAARELLRLPAEPGGALLIPGGLVHAIGAGCLIYEVQQTSNTTFRLFDWERLDAAGQPRPLHLEPAFQVIDPALPAPHLLRSEPAAGGGRNRWRAVLACRHFRLRQLELRSAATIPLDGSSFAALFVLAGAACCAGGGMCVPLPAGASCLVPAGAGRFRLRPTEAGTRLLLTTLGDGGA
jgi:mannose-6-phosphate isomerase